MRPQFLGMAICKGLRVGEGFDGVRLEWGWRGGGTGMGFKHCKK